VTVKNALSSGYSGGSGVVGFDASSALTAAVLKDSISDGTDHRDIGQRAVCGAR
jgi:hypothetical protein